MSELKCELGKRYGPYVVIRRATHNYPNNNTARWVCKCVHCGAKRIYTGNRLRFGDYRHKCKECGGR